ncbi:MAG: hypothetical protein KGK30_06790, partial [Elusimicrobia bacterium]|nr:hypothetical protein [Elusimicrobiota bacterium]
MEELTGLSRARSDLAEAGERLTRIKEALSGGEPDAIRPKRWRALRRLLEMTREALSSWSAAPRKDEENAALWRESSELQANGLKTENALRTLDRRQRALDDERSSVLAELTRVHEGWRLLRLRWEREGSIPQAKAAELFERWYAVISSACETLEEERQVQSDAREAEQLWRWLLDSGFPALEARLREGDEALLLPALRRLLAEQDRRWTQSRRLWADQVSERSLKAFEELQLKCAQLENELRLTEARACERERALAEEATLAARLSAQAQAERDRALEEPHVLRQRLEGMARELEETRRAQAEAVSATNLWRMLHETARADIGRLMEQLAEEQRKSAESQSELEAAQGR